MPGNSCSARISVPSPPWIITRSGLWSTISRPALFTSDSISFLPYINTFIRSGRWESNPVYMLPKHAYYRYTTARAMFAHGSTLPAEQLRGWGRREPLILGHIPASKVSTYFPTACPYRLTYQWVTVSAKTSLGIDHKTPHTS